MNNSHDSMCRNEPQLSDRSQIENDRCVRFLKIYILYTRLSKKIRFETKYKTNNENAYLSIPKRSWDMKRSQMLCEDTETYEKEN